MTVGPGITPGLLTLASYTAICRACRQALAGYARCAQLPPVGSCTPPWERFAVRVSGSAAFLTHISCLRIAAIWWLLSTFSLAWEAFSHSRV